MTTTTHVPATAAHAEQASTATRRMLGCGAVAGPLFVVVAGAQMLTRDGFDVTQHPLSLLSLGTLGGIQIANFVVSGVLYIIGAAGMRRAMGRARGSRWTPRLIGAFGVCLVVGGLFVADPVDGFPTAATVAPASPSWHSIVHGIAPAFGFLALIVSCFVLARFFAQRRDRVRAIASAAVGLALFAPDAFMGRPGFTVALAAAAAVGWSWASYVAFHLSRQHAR
jgi:Protein of unknown function (DUF998)